MKLLAEEISRGKGRAHRQAWNAIDDVSGIDELDEQYRPFWNDPVDILGRFDEAIFSAQAYLGQSPRREFGGTESALLALGVGALLLMKRSDLAQPLLSGFATEQVFRALAPADFVFHDDFIIPEPKPRWWQVWKR